MKVCLLTTYELGHQPFGIASPARWLEDAGASVTCTDLAIECLDEENIRQAGLIAIYLPMHTATRLAVALIPKIKEINNRAHLTFYGLYAMINKSYLQDLGGETILSGEIESRLVGLYQGLTKQTDIKEEGGIILLKQNFRVPKRSGLPDLNRYAKLNIGLNQTKIVGYTEASRGCKHLCRHCPVVPVYKGRFFVVQREIVLADVRQQIKSGAEHITFGDPDFFNGPTHAVRLVKSFHEEFPNITYDVTIKVEHLLAHPDKLAILVETGCLFVTTAVEETDNNVLIKLEKRHTREDFVNALILARSSGLTLCPTFIPFHPWTTLLSYLDLLSKIVEMDLVENVAPIQLAIRLLIPRYSRILELKEIENHLGHFDAEKLSYNWKSSDPNVDDLQSKVNQTIQQGLADGSTRRDIFKQVWMLANEACNKPIPALLNANLDNDLIPSMSEPWYCCAEPTDAHFAGL